MSRRWSFLFFSAALSACSPTADTGTPLDAATPIDTGTSVDAATPIDGNAPLDAATPTDTGTSVDAATPIDGNAPLDAADAHVDPIDGGPARAQLAIVSTYLGGTFSYRVLADGALEAVSATALDAGAHFYGLAVHPSGGFAYAFDLDAGDIVGYAIASDGTLTHLASSPVHVGGHPIAGIVDPSGGFLYVGFDDGSTIRMLPIDAAGALDLAAAVTTTVDGSVSSFAMDASGHFLFVAYGAGIGVFARDAAGTLSPIGRATATTTVFGGSLALDASAAHLFNAHFAVRGFTVAASGTLTDVASHALSTDVGSDSHARSIVTDPSGHFLYGINMANGHVNAWSIEAATGLLTMIDSETTVSPCSIAVAPDGRFIYVADDLGTITVLARDAEGRLAPTGGTAPINGLQPQIVVIDAP
ncbi:Hypothetical protein I5071_110 (plasmid) [Sandaracinus amylolyticus]|nr:beta-propeller fold lactonase family protein [Sandaracinus sp.]QRN75735.1 Hypothetical protein MSR10575_88220 [Sandaracinus sp.]UJR87220.1 Hypothetical protein I5071_110 [Sandaracinus amylolyticus]